MTCRILNSDDARTRWRDILDAANRGEDVDGLLLTLAAEPRPVGCKKLKGYDNLYRLRIGDWRLIYAVEDDRLVVLVVEIAPRGGVHRDL